MKKYFNILLIGLFMFLLFAKVNTYAEDITIIPTCRANTLEGESTITTIYCEEDEDLIVKVYLPENGFININEIVEDDDYAISLYSDIELENLVSMHTLLLKGTYYLSIYKFGAIEDDTPLILESYYYPYKSDTNLRIDNKWYTGCADYYGNFNKTYYKFAVKKNSYIDLCVNTRDSEDLYCVHLCNNKKNEIDTFYFSDTNDHVYIPVSAGTYYIIIDQYVYQYKAVLKTVPTPTNTTKEKAKKITLGKETHAYTYAKDKKTYKQYFKITLTKSQRLKSNEYWSLYDENGKSYCFSYDRKNHIYISKNKLKKGTYYVIINKTYSCADKKNSKANHYSILFK